MIERNLYILIGNIAAGKSTWLKSREIDRSTGYKSKVIISRDNIRKQFAKSIGREYIYEEYLEKIIHSIIEEYTYGYCHIGTPNIFIDETNMTTSGRQMFIDIASDYGYKITVVVFPDLGEDEHVRRRLLCNHGCELNDGLTEDLWRRVYREKKDKYEEPTLEEGFDEIIYV